MSAAHVDLTLQQGESFTKTWNISGLDLAAWTTGASQVRKSLESPTPALTFTVAVASTGVNTGTVTVSADVANINSMEATEHVWDLFLSGGPTGPIHFFEGVVKVRPRVTR